MNQIQDAFINALLADATYALGDSRYHGTTPDDLFGFLSKRMTDTLARYISDHFSIKDHIESDDKLGSGFDATVWSEISTNKIYVSMQGTKGFEDWITDADLTLGDGIPSQQIVDLVNWWSRISTPPAQLAPQIARTNIPLLPPGVGSVLPSYFYLTTSVFGEGIIPANSTISVNGHSLGGNLASTFALLFDGGSVNVSDVETFNSAGYGWWAPVAVTQIKNLIGTSSNLTSYSDENFFAKNGISATTRTFFNTQLGSRLGISQEQSSFPTKNHYMYKLTDYLAVGDTLSKLDQNLNLSLLNIIVDSSANKTEASYEGVLDGIRRLFGLWKTPNDSTPIADVDENPAEREKFYQNLFEVRNLLETGGAFNYLVGNTKFVKAADDHGESAKSDFGQFLALYYLTPFALQTPEWILKNVNPSLYQLWWQDENTRTGNPNDDKVNFSNRWYEDRAAMLLAQSTRNTDDTPTDTHSNRSGYVIDYNDLTQNSYVYSEAQTAGQHFHIHNLFGSDANNDMQGTTQDDRVYGGEGDDIIHGNGGYDYLEGNAGNDFIFGSNDADQIYGGAGNDQIFGESGNDILVGGLGDDQYFFGSGFGRDMIKDTDGTNQILFNFNELTSLTEKVKGSHVYYDNIDNPTIEAVLMDEGDVKSLIISSVTKSGVNLIPSGNSVTIKNYVPSNFSFTLNAGADPIPDPLAYTITPSSPTGSFMALQSINDQYPDVTPEFYSINATGTANADAIEGTYTGKDFINGGAGDDLISGGMTDLFYWPGGVVFSSPSAPENADNISGGDGNDFIVINSGEAIAHGDKGNDFLDSRNYLAMRFYGYTTSEVVPTRLQRDQVWMDFNSLVKRDIEVTQNGTQTQYITGIRFPTLTTQYREIVSNYTGQKFIARLSPTNDALELTYDYSIRDGQYVVDNGWSVEVGYSNFHLVNGATYASIANRVGANLFGDEGDDILRAGDYRDYLKGGAGKDLLLGGYGNDTLDGGTEADRLWGEEGDDLLIGGEGDDILEGGKNTNSPDLTDNDVLYGGNGTDTLNGYFGNDYLDGGTGTDTLNGGEGNNYLYGGDDTDVDKLYGGSGNDIFVMGKNDVAQGGGGHDIFILETHKVTNQAPTANGNFSSNNNALSSDSSNSTNSLSDRLFSHSDAAPSNNLLNTDGAVYIFNTEGNNTVGIVGATSMASAITYYFNNSLYLSFNNDLKIVIQDLQNSSPIQIVFGGSKEELIDKAQNNQIIDFSLTDDHFLNGVAPLNQANVTAADVTLGKLAFSITQTATMPSQYLAGSLVNDSLTANAAGTTFIGGRGDDQLNGGLGSDTYLIRKGDGNDTITEVGGTNHIKFDKNLAVSDVNVYRSGANLVFGMANNQSVTLKNLFNATTGVVNATAKIEDVTFYDGTVFDFATLKAHALVGSAGNDSLMGFELNETLQGGKGNDYLSDRLGNETYIYNLGDGADVISDTVGTDSIQLGAGINPSEVIARSDTQNNLILNFIDGGSITVLNAFNSSVNFTANAIESIQFADNSVWDQARIKSEVLTNQILMLTGTAQNDQLVADAGDSIISGGLGDDRIVGGAGNDIYKYNLGDGTDVIIDADGTDQLQLGAGISDTNLYAARVNNDLVLTLDSGNRITIKDGFLNQGNYVGVPTRDAITNNLIKRWIPQAEKLIESQFGLVGGGDLYILFDSNAIGSEAARVEYNTDQSITLVVNETAFTNAKIQNGPTYIDRIIAHEMVHAVMDKNMDASRFPSWFTEGSAEFIQGADERVFIDSAVLVDQASFNSNFTTTPASPSTSAGYTTAYVAVKMLDHDIRSHGGNGIRDVFDQLKVGKSLDQTLAIISANLGNTLAWNNLVSFENSVRTNGYFSMQSLIQLGDADTGSIAGSDYGNPSLDPNDVVSDTDIGESLHFNVIELGQYRSTTPFDGALESIQFADGTVWDQTRIQQDVDKYIVGTEANDNLYGSWLDNIMIGGKGNDQLDGQGGDDIYRYNLGDGNDVIADPYGTVQIQLGLGIDVSQIILKRDDLNNLNIAVGNTGSILVSNAFYTWGALTNNAVASLKFYDGTVWDTAQILQEVSKNSGKIIQGTNGNDSLITGTIYDDTIIGGKGNDYLFGDSGNDTFVYSAGDGLDTIEDISGSNTLVLGAGISASNVSIKRDSAGNATLFLPDGNTIVLMLASSPEPIWAVSSIKFSDNTVWNTQKIYSDVISNTATDGNIYGFDSFDIADNLVTLSSNNNSIFAYRGADTIIVDRGTTNNIDAGEGNDQIYVSGGISNNLVGGAGDDTYHFTASSNAFATNASINIFDASGNDRVVLDNLLSSQVKITSDFNRLFISAEGLPQFTLALIDYNSHAIQQSTAIESIQFSNGEVWDQAKMLQQSLLGTSADETISGFDTADVLMGGAGNDTLYGWGAADTLVGGKGNDKLLGDSGDDLYQYSLGDGYDSIQDWYGKNTISFGPGIAQQDIAIYYSYDSLILEVGTIGGIAFGAAGNWFGLDSLSLKFSDNTQLNSSEIIQRGSLISSQAITINGTGNADSLRGTGANDIINGYAGNDVLIGGVGADQLFGGDGNDQLFGGLGRDVLDGGNGDDFLDGGFSSDGGDHFIGGDGNDILQVDMTVTSQTILEGGNNDDIYRVSASGPIQITDTSGNDTLEFGDGWTSASTEVFQSGSELIIYDKKQRASDGITIEGFFDSTGQPTTGAIESIKFADGTVWGSSQITAKTVRSTDKDDVITLYTTNDVIAGRLGDDSFTDPAGNDTYVFNLGDGYDRITDKSGSDTIIFGNNISQDQVHFWMNGAAYLEVAIDSPGTNSGGGFGYYGNAGQIQIDGYFNFDSAIKAYQTNKFVENFVFSDGSTITIKKVLEDLGYDVNPPSAPAASFDTTGKIISGNGEPGSAIKVKNANGSQIGSATANATTGTFSITLATALTNSQIVTVTATDAVGNISNATSVTAPDKTPPSQPTAAFDATGKIISGTAEMNSTVNVKNAGGTQLGTAIADASTGAYTITLATALINKETVNVTASDAAGNTSTVKSITAPDLTAPAMPTASIDTTGKIITGTAEKSSTVAVKNAAGTQLGSVTANASTGAYTITLATALLNGELLNVTAKDAAGNISPIKSINAPDKTAPSQPSAAFDATGKIITGTAEINSTVIVKNSAGTQIGTGTANATTGAYTVTLATALINKETVNVTAKDAAGNPSTAKAITAPDLTPPALPTASIDTTGKIITGTAEKSSTVAVKNAAGTQLGSVTANASTGAYTITLATALLNGELLNVTAKDAAGNVSPVKAINAPDKTAPAQPTGAFDTTGKIITGTAEVNSTLIVKNSGGTQIGTATANATTGAYTVTLATALTHSEIVNVTAKDAAGNTSTAKAVTAPSSAPLAVMFFKQTPTLTATSQMQTDSLVQAMAAFSAPAAAETQTNVVPVNNNQVLLGAQA